MISPQRKKGFRSRSQTRKDDGESPTIKPRGRGRSFSISSRSSARSRSTSTTRTGSTVHPPSPKRRGKASVKKSQGAARRPSADLVVLNDNNSTTTNSTQPGKKGRNTIRRTFSFTSIASSTGGTSKSSPPASTATSKEKDISYVPPKFTPSNEGVVADKEVDFFANPTVLSRLIQNQKFSAAISRLEKQGPGEASVWVCTKRKLPPTLHHAETKKTNEAINVSSRSLVSTSKGSAASNNKKSTMGKKTVKSGKAGAASASDDATTNSDTPFTFRQLPIHMACGSLFRVEDQALRQDLEQLIARLVIAYPEGCSRLDHQGRYPLHECIWYNAAPPIVSALLMAAPEIARLGDSQGVTPTILNEHRKCSNPMHKKMVRGMLKKSPEFWKAARKEAEFRMKHRDIPATDATITSTSVLASSVVEDETIASKDKSHQNDQRHQQHQRKQLLNEVHQQQPEPQQQQAPAKPLEWAQLEKRAIALEQKLAESYEHIYVLNQQLNELKGAKNALQVKLDKFANSDLGKRVVKLENEKDELQFHLARSQALLAKHGISLEEANVAEGMPPLPPLHISFAASNAPTEDTAATTSDEENNENAFADEQYDDKARLELEKKRLAMLNQQLDILNQDQAAYEERAQYFCEIVPDDATAKSEITTDDFTAMTPASRFHPTRPEPDANASLIGGVAMTKSIPKMSAVMEDRVSSTEPLPTISHQQPMGRGTSNVGNTRTGRSGGSTTGGGASMTGSNRGRRASLSTSDHNFELDSVLEGAMELNGGQGLSPDMVALWKSTTGTITPGGKLASVMNDTSNHSLGEKEYEQQMMMAKLRSRPGADLSPLASPPHQRVFLTSQQREQVQL